mmetsp:Transcript_51876/g.132010  ORF Transcript_51876/g.132010 Transcript_51876/m.132010 type:complete len:222 (+) Transcript_51876:64-729(+)
MDIYNKYPDYLAYSKYIGNFSQHDNAPHYTITKSQDDLTNPGRPLPRQKSAADHFGPGQYPTDRDFPLASRLEEMPVGWSTRSASSKKFVFPKENRQEAIERTWPGRKNPGPGAYHQGCGPRVGMRSTETELPAYSVPQHLRVGGRPLPRAVAAADHLGPGTYETKDPFAVTGLRKTRAMEKAAKRNKETWASPQYSHIFRCIKPGKSASTGSLPTAAVTH